MGTKTGISWTDSTWNPIRGCSRVSEGCRHCYAETTAYRFKGEGQAYEGLAVLKNGHASWTGKVDWVDEHWGDPLRWSKPRRIFVNSMSDLFHENVPDLWIDKIFAVMQHAQSRGHTFQVLTKRPQRMYDYFANPLLYTRWMRATDIVRMIWPKLPIMPLSDPAKYPLQNVWLGVSVENQKSADERIPLLLRTPSAVRFLSCEPLLGPLDLEYPKTMYPDGPPTCCSGTQETECGCQGKPVEPPMLYGIDQIIIGGESGPRARPCHLSWVRSLIAQAARWRVATFFKQMGGNIPDEDQKEIQRLLGHSVHDRKGSDINEFPPDLRTRQFPDSHRASLHEKINHTNLLSKETQ